MHVAKLLFMLISAYGRMDASLALPMDSQAVDNFMDHVEFIRRIMIQDRMWLPILKEQIKIESLPRRHSDHFTETPRADGKTQMIVTSPLGEITKLLISNTMIGTEVNFCMAVIRRSISCSLMKYVSLQGFLLHHLITVDKTFYIVPNIVLWLEQMVRMSIDKLVAINEKLPVMAAMYAHVQSLLGPTVDFTNNELNVISQEMLREIDSMCEPSKENGHYKTLITELKKSMTVDELNVLNDLMVDEQMRGLAELNNIKEIHEYHGSLTIDENVEPTEFGNLDAEELKKIITINRVKMNYLYLNVPLKSLANSQLKNILNSQHLVARA